MKASSQAKPNSFPPLRIKLATPPTPISAKPKKSMAPGSMLFSMGDGWLEDGTFIKFQGTNRGSPTPLCGVATGGTPVVRYGKESSFQGRLLGGRQVVPGPQPA